MPLTPQQIIHYYYSGGGAKKKLPTDFQGLRFWFDAVLETAYANNAAIDSPTDWSGNEVVISSSGTNRPVWQEDAGDGLPGFRFDGSDDFWQAASKDDFNFMHQDESTVIWIVKLNVLNANQIIYDSMRASLGNTGRMDRFSYDSTGDRLDFQSRCGAGGSGSDFVYNFNPTTHPITSGTHIIVTRFKKDRKDADNQDVPDFENYIDGTFVGSSQGTLPPSSNESTDAPRIGSRTGAVSQPFNGWLIRALAYDRDLSLEEIEEIIDGLPGRRDVNF